MWRRNILIGMLAIVVVVATVGGVAYVLHTRAQADEASYPGLHGPVSVVCPGATCCTPPPGIVDLASARATTARRHSRSRMCGTTWRMGHSWARWGHREADRHAGRLPHDPRPRAACRATRNSTRSGIQWRTTTRQICSSATSGLAANSSYPEMRLAPLHTRAPPSSCSMRTPATSL